MTSAKLHPRTALILLTALNLLNYIDRSVLFAVQPLVQDEFHLSNAEVGYLTSAFLLFYMIAASTIFVHRRRAVQEGTTAFRMWGYPLLPALFITAAAVLLVYSYQSNLRNSLVGTLLILAGVPLFAYFRPKQVR